VSRQAYHPDRGEIIHLNLSPAAGHELAGPHFALVLSTVKFSRATGFCIVLPGTSKFHAEQRFRTSPLMVRIPDMPELPKEGWLYTHQIKAVDYRERDASFIAKVDDDFLIEMMDRVRALIDPDSPV
jgi:mRNA-degrading endonuclease toxin of MazEF toxin-antitoxin module